MQHFNEHSDPNVALREWNKTFLLIADINAPVRLRKVRSDRQPWMTDEIKKLSFHRDYLKKKAVVSNSSAFHSAYKKCKLNLLAKPKLTILKQALKTARIAKKVGPT